MERYFAYFFVVLGIGLIVFLGATFFAVFREADPSVQAPIVAGLFALLVAIIALWRERSRSREEAHRQSKIEVYGLFFDVIFSTLRESKKGSLESFVDSSEFQDKFFAIMRGAVFYGSPKVLNALSNWKSEPVNARDPLHAIRKVGDVLLAMRKDIGLSNLGIDNITVHQIYVTDDLRKRGQIR